MRFDPLPSAVLTINLHLFLLVGIKIVFPITWQHGMKYPTFCLLGNIKSS